MWHSFRWHCRWFWDWLIGQAIDRCILIEAIWAFFARRFQPLSRETVATRYIFAVAGEDVRRQKVLKKLWSEIHAAPRLP